jgi:hypothetical protein
MPTEWKIVTDRLVHDILFGLIELHNDDQGHRVLAFALCLFRHGESRSRCRSGVCLHSRFEGRERSIESGFNRRNGCADNARDLIRRQLM